MQIDDQVIDDMVISKGSWKADLTSDQVAALLKALIQERDVPWKLGDLKWLVSTRCWWGAYNEGYGYWVVNGDVPYQPVFVTASGSYFFEGQIVSHHKGRGPGDCRQVNEWTWDGHRFLHTASYSTGSCLFVAPGGPWLLPTLITDVHWEQQLVP